MLLGQSRSLKNHVKIHTSNANESKDVKTGSHVVAPQNDKFQKALSYMHVAGGSIYDNAPPLHTQHAGSECPSPQRSCTSAPFVGTRDAHALPAAAVLGRGSHVSWVYQGVAGRLRRLITTDVPDKVHQVGEDGLEGHRRS
jgi:hypothetical protein